MDLDQIVQAGVKGVVGALRVDHDGSPGALIGKVFGITADKKYGTYSAMENTAGASVSELYWTTSGAWNSLLTVTNFAAHTDVITVSLTSTTTEFVLPPITLGPLEILHGGR